MEQGDPCHPSLPCCDDLICNGYACGPRPPVHHHDHYGTGGAASVLPNTGAGQITDASDLITLAVLGGAAIAAGWFLRGDQPPAETVED
ncbi:MAG TPA: hypothetical protein VFP05_13190 [Thermomicrobiales bacterium]|nr:hypothetical protein [Thermomicrobiales bacterium]